MNKIRILGIDPGYAIVGVGIIEYSGNKFTVLDYFALTTEAKEPIGKRIKKIYDELDAVIKKFKPTHMAIEELFFNNNAKTAINVGQARGVILLAAENNDLPVWEYTPLQIKQAVVGYGRAEKTQVQQMVKALLGLCAVPKPDDVADALAVAVCHAHSYNPRNVLFK